MSESLHYPFIFDFKQPIAGNGFLAGVEILGGRALMRQEDGQWWLYGIFPATLSECGQTPNECFLRYMEELKAVLFDFAAEADSFDQFESELTSFLKQPSVDEEAWLAAQRKLRETVCIHVTPARNLSGAHHDWKIEGQSRRRI